MRASQSTEGQHRAGRKCLHTLRRRQNCPTLIYLGSFVEYTGSAYDANLPPCDKTVSLLGHPEFPFNTIFHILILQPSVCPSSVVHEIC